MDIHSLLSGLSGVLLGVGCFFAITGSLGTMRMPDFYTRLHPAGKTDTLAQALIVLALVLQCNDLVLMGKLILLSGLLFVTAPTATHAVAKAAYLDGLRPYLSGAPAPSASKTPSAEDPPGDTQA